MRVLPRSESRRGRTVIKGVPLFFKRTDAFQETRVENMLSETQRIARSGALGCWVSLYLSS